MTLDAFMSTIAMTSLIQIVQGFEASIFVRRIVLRQLATVSFKRMVTVACLVVVDPTCWFFGSSLVWLVLINGSESLF